ncbi:1-aminocyclopropane-1-carboxylate deaminase/D-cysteine desulfhydrase [Campylobacter estrildidarum]|uniref:1-aminocyclopropane-1-carboxylate deaminase n=1 Tax=Campylobacter estrildidarum TaxID=2510189 RepID=A0A4U7BTZ9_9BACT|nr:1-aminocyclopropane-1-carboxylate deaminase/D-cysteine desulfhydrase [Campylobacter estrildidarum]TKX31807.1 1-aminocyclopropane-1-carboxylate deaminase [Campylobacter estrildidarum]
MLQSTIDKICFKGFEFYIKRDDLLGEINGNKARKLAFYFSQVYSKNQRFISYGGIQSNALATLSIFCLKRNIKLIFVCRKIPNFLKENPCGNYALALKNKVEIIETNNINLKKYALSLCNKEDIFIEQGIANLNAELGYKELANEIKEQSIDLNLEFDIFLPSGTGTSAAFLAKHSKFKIFTCSCIGDESYLKKQILELIQDYDFSNLEILKSNKKYHFGKPYREIYQLYKELKQECNIEFDLLYDMIGLNIVLQRKWEKPLLYIHQGGILGNVSMLQRYAFKGFK